MSHETVYAFYDLSVSPVTFDILQFLVCADSFRQFRRAKNVQCSIVLGPDRGFRKQSRKDHDLSDAEKFYRLHHVLEPCCRLLKAHSGVNVFYDREDADRYLKSLPESQVFPRGYSVETGGDPSFFTILANGVASQGFNTEVLAPSEAALETIDKILEREADKRPLIALTVRQSSSETIRNSTPQVWVEFAQYVKSKGYRPIGIPDTSDVLSGAVASLSDTLEWCPLASLDVDLRAALYQRAALSMSREGGPAFINLFMANVASLFYIDPDVYLSSPQRRKFLIDSMGIDVGQQLAWNPRNRFIVWKKDTLEALCHGFNQFRESVEA